LGELTGGSSPSKARCAINTHAVNNSNPMPVRQAGRNGRDRCKERAFMSKQTKARHTKRAKYANTCSQWADKPAALATLPAFPPRGGGES
jgi:hypothetical protein